MLLTQKIKVACAALLIAMPGLVTAQDTKSLNGIIRPDDIQRLEGLNETAGESLRGAFAMGDKGELTILADALEGQPMSSKDAMAVITGQWSCRMIKLGGGLPIVVYPDFTCVTSDNGAFEKISGSQRTKGKIHADEDRLIYLGTGFIAGDTPPDYSDLPAEVSPQDSPQRVPEIGVVEMTGKNEGRILFPSPYLESRLNILMLTR